MPNQFLLRFESPVGGVFLFMNGFVLFGPEDTGRASSQITPFLRPGNNSFELIAQRAGTQAAFSIVDMSEGDPENAPILLEGRLSGGAARLESFLTIENEVPAFAWHEARLIEDIAAQQGELYEAVETLARLLERGPYSRLLTMLSMKHSEIAVAVGLSQAEIEQGLVEGLSVLRESAGFRIDLASVDEVLPLMSSDGRIVTMRRRSGGDAIRIIDGMINPGFSVTMAIIHEGWRIVR